MQIIKEFNNQQLKQLALLCSEMNNKPHLSSSFCPKTADSIYKEFVHSNKQGYLRVCKQNEQVSGICFIWPDQERLMVDTVLLVPEYSLPQYDNIADCLLEQFMPTFVGYNFKFYFNKLNVSCASYLIKRNANRMVNEYILVVTPDKVKNFAKADTVTTLQQSNYAQFIELHDSVFPDIYISGKHLVEDIGINREVFVIKEQDTIKAYSVFEQQGEHSGCAEIICVRNGYRHCGLGRQVLSYLLTNKFANKQLQNIYLIVDCDNENALALYFDVGFEIEQENNSFELYSPKE